MSLRLRFTCLYRWITLCIPGDEELRFLRILWRCVSWLEKTKSDNITAPPPAPLMHAKYMHELYSLLMHIPIYYDVISCYNHELQ
jgi:hypothetical protein